MLVYHYSKEKREVLTTQHYGTGLKGAESKRLRATDSVKKRLYFYLKNEGIESGVGTILHPINVEDETLYDLVRDCLNFRKKNLQLSDDAWMNWVERSLVALGYKGIFNSLDNVGCFLGDVIIKQDGETWRVQ